MHVAIDAPPLTVPTGGARRHTWELSVALAERFPEDGYWLLSDQAFALPGDAPANLKTGPAPHGRMERKWWSYGVQRAMGRIGANVFWGPDFSVPYLPLRPSVLTILDLSPWKNPAWAPGSARVRRRTPWLLKMHSATVVMTISEAIKREIIEHFRVPAAKGFVVPLAAGRRFHPHP